MGLYILQFSLFLAVFYIVYLVFLKKETFFQYNRWYVLITPCLALILPFIVLDFLRPETVVGQAFVNLPPVLLGDFSGAAAEEQITQQVSTSFSLGAWVLQHAWLLLYGIGFMVALFFLLKKILQFNSFKKTGELKKDQEVAYYEVKNSRMACTFFNQIFIGDEITNEQRNYILQHELVHVSQKHSLDLLFFEVLKILFWFHPAIYAYQKQLSSLHEFIADEEVTRHASKTNYYQSLLNVAFGTHQISFINQFFNHSLIKKRILMLQKSKSSTRAKLKYLIVLPLIALMLTYVSCSDEEEVVESTTSEIPAPPPPPPPAPPANFPEEDVQLMNNLQQELNVMEEEGKGFDEITEAFFTEKGKHIKTKDSYYRFKIYSKWILESSKERKIKEGTWNEEDQKNQNYMESTGYKQTYEDYVAHRKTVVRPSTSKSEGIPFTAIQQVPVYPGCDSNKDKETIKECFSDNIKEFVNANFNTGLGEEIGLEGVNRVYVRFTIAKDGSVKDVQARAPSPELQKEAERVVNSLPRMQPGMQDGKAVGVFYSLPIIFQMK